jgi:hypothetical protein
MEAAVAEQEVEAIAPVRIINITKHFAERWAERVLEIGKDYSSNAEKQKAIKDYAAQNFERIKEHANETFRYATYIWQGQLYDNVTRSYYIQEDIIIVTNTQADAMITNYKVDFGFPGIGNTQARKSLIEEIQNLTKQKEEFDFNVLVDLESKGTQADRLEEQIKILKEQLQNAEAHRVFLKEEMKNIGRHSNHLDLEIKKYTNMLVNSKEYREDLKSL